MVTYLKNFIKDLSFRSSYSMAKKNKEEAQVEPVSLAENKEDQTTTKDRKEIDAFILDDQVTTECSNEARLLYEKSRYGTLLDDGRVQLTFIETYYLVDKNRIRVKSGVKELPKASFLKKCIKLEKNFWVRYAVYADFRNRGYIIKTALKFGADFRVYNKGIKPGEDHARWIVYPVKETSVLTWYDFAAKNRVAHSTKKRLLIGIVDEENSVTYYEIKWIRP
jgi:tRNA-intron endonuclease, archaea type